MIRTGTTLTCTVCHRPYTFSEQERAEALRDGGTYTPACIDCIRGAHEAGQSDTLPKSVRVPAE